MPQEDLNQTFDLGDDYFSGYFSNSEITDIDSSYIGSVIDLDALTKISRQLNVSMGSMMGLVNGFAIAIYMILIYLSVQDHHRKKCTVNLNDKDSGLYQW